MDQIELGRALGYLQARTERQEATLQDHGRRLSKLERRQRAPQDYDWKAALPYVYGVTILGLAIAGKISWIEALSVMSGSR